VDPAVAHEADEVQAAAGVFCLSDDLTNYLVGGKCPVVNGVVDLRDVHHRDATRA